MLKNIITKFSKKQDSFIDKLYVNCSLIKWNDHKNNKPIETKSFFRIGIENLKVYDESILTYFWYFSNKTDELFEITHKSQGIITVIPIIPTYVNVHQVNKQYLKIQFNRNNCDLLVYRLIVYNSFRDSKQKIVIPEITNQKIKSLNFQINYENILKQSVFKEQPKAYIISFPNTKEKVNNSISSFDGNTWSTSLKNNSSNNKKLLVTWTLSERFPKHRSYIFAYGSLMNPLSIKETLPEFCNKRTVVPAKLKGYKRSFSAVTENVNKFMTSNREIPKYMAYLNIEQCSFSYAYGLLIPVTCKEMEFLDTREWIYTRIDVTNFVETYRIQPITISDTVSIFAYTCIQSIEKNELEGNIAIGEDYVNSIMDGHILVDQQLSDSSKIFQRDFKKITSEYLHYLKTFSSNTRTKSSYPYNKRS